MLILPWKSTFFESLDGAVAIFDSVGGVEPQSETVWRQADKYNVPRIAFVNKMDRVGADSQCGGNDGQKFGITAVPLQLPIGKERLLYRGRSTWSPWKAYSYAEEDFGATVK